MDSTPVRWMRRPIASSMLSLILCLGAPTIAAADEPEATAQQKAEPSRSERAEDIGNKVFDAVVLRPFQSLAVVGGTALFVPAALMASPGGRPVIEEAWDFFVVIRYEDAWTRRLGQF